MADGLWCVSLCRLEPLDTNKRLSIWYGRAGHLIADISELCSTDFVTLKGLGN